MYVCSINELATSRPRCTTVHVGRERTEQYLFSLITGNVDRA